jgi:hypothetical protein
MITAQEYRLLDDVLARLIDAKTAGFGVADEHLALVRTLQQRLHAHEIAQRWEDGIDVAYCRVCGASWGDTPVRHGKPINKTTDREDGIDWPVWVCACGCGDWGARWLP